jgi:tetratricopeptide (TPR) repeat protein
MLVELERIPLDQTGVRDDHFDAEDAASQYKRAFRDYGIDVHTLGPEAAALVKRSAIREHLLAGLEDWALHLTNSAKEEQRQTARLLLAVARDADPDPWRNRLHELVLAHRGPGLDQLLLSAPVEELPPATLGMLGTLVIAKDSHPSGPQLQLLRRAQQRFPADFWINHQLAQALTRAQPPQPEEAIGYFRAAIAVRPQSPGVHLNLGGALLHKGDLDGAIAEVREAIRLKGDYAAAHTGLGNLLEKNGQLDEAIAESREAIRLRKAYPLAHYNLGVALEHNGQHDEAIAEYREAIRLNNEYPEAHYNLGVNLQNYGQQDEAVAEYRETIRLRDDYPEAHCNLGLILLTQGQFAEALAPLRRGHELGSNRPGWDYPSAQWVKRCERLVELDARLPWIVLGVAWPRDAAECAELAFICATPAKQMYATAVRFYVAALAAGPRPRDIWLYNPACAAARAGCGRGKDADGLDEKQRASLRQQALGWLRADLTAWNKRLDNDADKAGPSVAQLMKHWLTDGDFAGVRGPDALAKLPEAERQEWQKLWAEVAETLARAQGKIAS